MCAPQVAEREFKSLMDERERALSVVRQIDEKIYSMSGMAFANVIHVGNSPSAP